MKTVNLKEKILRPELVFLFLACIFGTTFLILTPPFQVPDEPNHFFRAYHISEGNLTAVKYDQRIGDFLPTNVWKATRPFNFIIGGGKYTDSTLFASTSHLPLKTEERTFVDFNNTALYSPVCYIPQAIGISIFRLFNVSVLGLFYAARAFALLFWIILVFFSIRIIPVYKWLFCFLALLPMSVYVNSSLSADVMTNGVSFLFIAIILNSRFTKNLSRKRLLLITVLLFILPLLKTVYAALALLILILPFREIASVRKRVLVILLLIAVPSLAFMVWTGTVKDLYLTYDEYNPTYRDDAALAKGVDFNKQLAQMKKHKVIFFRMIRRSTFRLSKYHIPGYIGVFGWLDVTIPKWFSYTLYCCVLLIALSEFDPKYQLNWPVKILFAITFFLILSGIFLTQYLTWTGMGPQVVKFIQARYLIPFYPLLFMCLYGLFTRIKSPIPLIASGISLFSLLYCTFILYERYY